MALELDYVAMTLTRLAELVRSIATILNSSLQVLDKVYLGDVFLLAALYSALDTLLREFEFCEGPARRRVEVSG